MGGGGQPSPQTLPSDAQARKKVLKQLKRSRQKERIKNILAGQVPRQGKGGGKQPPGGGGSPKGSKGVRRDPKVSECFKPKTLKTKAF